MRRQKIILGVLASLLAVSTMWSCDRSPLSSDEITTETYRSAPGTSLEQELSSLSGGATRYTCSVTTLNEPGSEKEYTKYSSIHFFPNNERVARSGGEKITWSFVITDKAASRSESTWSKDVHDNVVRTATCDLPDVKGIEKEMARRLLKLDSDRERAFVQHSGNLQVHTVRENKNHQNVTGVQPMSLCSGGYFCTNYFLTVAYYQGAVISVYLECTGWDYFSGCNSYGGEGVPEYPELGECDGCPNDPCQYAWATPPWMCGNSPFDIIIDPSFSNNPCLNGVFTSAGSAPTIQGYLNNFDGTFSVAHLRLAGNPNLPSGVGARTYEPEDWIVKIDFNTSPASLGVRPTLEVATILMHELQHAEIYRKLLSLSHSGEITWSTNFFDGMKDDFPGLFDYYTRWYNDQDNNYPPPATSAQHEAMAEHYRDIIEDALREFDDSHDDEVYEALAWLGLMGEGEIDQATGLPPNPTIAWQNQSQQDRLVIIAETNGFRASNPPCQN